GDGGRPVGGRRPAGAVAGLVAHRGLGGAQLLHRLVERRRGAAPAPLAALAPALRHLASGLLQPLHGAAQGRAHLVRQERRLLRQRGQRIGHARDALGQVGLLVGGVRRRLPGVQVLLRGARQRPQVLRGGAHGGEVARGLFLLLLLRAGAQRLGGLGQALAGFLARALRRLRFALLALAARLLLLLRGVLLQLVGRLLQALLRVLLLARLRGLARILRQVARLLRGLLLARRERVAVRLALRGRGVRRLVLRLLAVLAVQLVLARLEVVGAAGERVQALLLAQLLQQLEAPVQLLHHVLVLRLQLRQRLLHGAAIHLLQRLLHALQGILELLRLDVLQDLAHL